jgi:transcriptional regulator GlxA family with amidase domain
MATQEPKTIALVRYPAITLLDMVGPLQVFSVLQGFDDQYRPVVADRIQPTPTDPPLTVTADKTLDQVPDPTVMLVPGGAGPTIKAMGDPAIAAYLRRVAGTSQVVGSVCTGAMILAAAGLPEGRNATTHWSHHRLLERLGATYLPERWVEDGKIITTAGVSAGIDMALALVARLTDEPTAGWSSSGSSTTRSRPSAGSTGARWTRDMSEPMVAQWVQTSWPTGRAPGQAERLSCTTRRMRAANREPAAPPPEEVDTMSSRPEPQPTAKSIEYPAEQLQLAGARWPWRPTALLALTVTAAIGVALLPAAGARRNRR